MVDEISDGEVGIVGATANHVVKVALFSAMSVHPGDTLRRNKMLAAILLAAIHQAVEETHEPIIGKVI